MGNTASMRKGSFGKKSTKVNAKKTSSARSATRTSISSSTTSIDSFVDQNTIHTKDGIIPHDACDELKIVREYLRLFDVHDIAGLDALIDKDSMRVIFSDAEVEMLAADFHQSLKELIAALPNMSFHFKIMKAAPPQQGEESDKDMIVTVTDYYGEGNHTGKPFGFGPYPPIEPTGMKAKDEDMELTFTVKNKKIIKIEVNAFGQVVGPPGFYTKLGGLIM